MSRPARVARLTVRPLLCLLAFASFPPCAHAQPLAAPLAARIDGLFADFDKRDTPGFAVGVVRDGRLIFARGYGQANLDDQIPITAATAFHLASLSKQFTAAAIALLLLAGKVSLDDPLSRYVPEAAKFGPKLTLAHLVYMTSGLPEYQSLKRANGTPWFSAFYFTRDDAIATTLAADALEFTPGTRWAYSNVNYMLLTKVVEVVSGERFADFASERLFRPLGMTATHVDDDSTAIVPHRAIGYAPRSADVVKQTASVGFTLRPGAGFARLVRNSPHIGGSGVFSTLEDLARWDDNWAHPKLGHQFEPLMHQRRKFAHDKDNDALGLVFGSIEGRTVVWYSGGDLDASTYMARFPKQKTTVICLSNMPTGDCEGRSQKVIRSLIEGGLLPK